MSDQLEESVALIALLRVRPNGHSWREIAEAVLECGSAVDLWTSFGSAGLFADPAQTDALSEAAADLVAWTADGTRMLTILDDEYPSRLRGIQQAPPVLFMRGESVHNDVAVSIVGSRLASPRGVDTAANIARAAVELGVTVTSGLAGGIDAAAHRAALDAGGRTVAFIGTGIRRSYPADNKELQAEIARRGLLVSQFWPDAPPQKHTFLMRNAVMSGYGRATIVVEAGETSGSRAQARMAVEHGRPVVLTETVVLANKWAQDMIGRPGVHVARSLDEVADVIKDLAVIDEPDASVRGALELMTA